MVDALQKSFADALFWLALPPVVAYLSFVSINGAWWALRRASRRIVRAGGIVALLFLGLWAVAMTIGGAPPTREEKEQNRAAQLADAAERAVMGGLLISGDAPQTDEERPSTDAPNVVDADSARHARPQCSEEAESEGSDIVAADCAGGERRAEEGGIVAVGGQPCLGRFGDGLRSDGGATNDVPRFLFTHVERGTNSVELAAAWTTNDVFAAVGLYYAPSLESNEWRRIDLRFDVANSTNCAWTIADPSIVTNAAGFFWARGFLAADDDDSDGVVNAREFLVGTDPDLADTDGDGLADGEEIGYATILPDDDFLWLDVSNGVAGVSHYKGVSGYFGHVWLSDGYSMTIQGRDCNELLYFVDGFVVISLDSEDLEPLYMDWNGDYDLRYDARSGGAVVVAGLNCDMAVMPGRCIAVVETNGASYAVCRAESQIANNAGLSGSRAVTYEVIVPLGEPDTVYVSYLDVGDSVAALDMDLGVQCPSMRSVLDTNELYTVLAPPGALRSRTTVKYFLGRNTDPRLLDTDGDGIPDGFPRVSEFDADGDGLADSIDPEPTVYGGDFHGQSTAWVSASFTNAEEILMVGYLPWVDSLIGEGLANGLYKLTVSVPNAPANPVLLSVGDYRVVVTNTGDCVFLLEKGRRYDLEVSQPEGTNFVYAAFDDIGHGSSLRANGSFLDGHWKSADGGKWLVAPVPIGPIVRGYVFWKPTVTVSPANWQPTLANPTETFTATVGDLPAGMAVSYHWYSSDPSVVSVGSPLLQTTGMTWHPSGGESPPVLTLEVTVPGGVQTAVYQYGGDATAQTRLSLAMPDTLFVNDDDDMDDGVTDYNQGLSHLLDDDMVLATVTFISDIPTNGILRLENDGFTGLVFDGEFSPLVCSEWELENETSFERVVRINPTAPSQSYLGSSLRLRFVPDTGSELAATTRFTVVRPIVEPICTETTNVVETGEMKSLVLNPCGVGVDREAYFKIDVEPADFPDDRIVWSASGDGEVQFRSGRKKGRRIGIFGSTPGDVKLDIAIGDAVSSHPTFDLRVVTNSVVQLSAWIICDKDESTPFTFERLRQMVKMANDVYSQIGMTFDLGDRIVVTNIPAAYNIQEEVMTNGMWNIETLTSAFPSCGGLKCFFVNAIVNDLTGNETETIGMNTQTGLVVSSSAHISTLAHEIGHAIGMRDVYVAPDGGLEMTDVTRSSYSPNDWNGGNFCNEHGASRYYPFEFRHSNIIRRMLMNGLHETGNAAAGADITFGSIQGYNALNIRMNVSTGVFYDGDDDNTLNPIHR